MPRPRSRTQVTVRTANRFNPVVGGPAAPLKTRALLASFAPSLMPRPSMNQGFAVGLSLLAAELVGPGVDGAIRRVLPGSAPFAVRIRGPRGRGGSRFGVEQHPGNR